jgi:hypothetical protein
MHLSNELQLSVTIDSQREENHDNNTVTVVSNHKRDQVYADAQDALHLNCNDMKAFAFERDHAHDKYSESLVCSSMSGQA